jgi:hypothetical protein
VFNLLLPEVRFTTQAAVVVAVGATITAAPMLVVWAEEAKAQTAMVHNKLERHTQAAVAARRAVLGKV